MTDRKISVMSVTMVVLMVLGIQSTQEYRFFTMESVHLLLYDASAIWDMAGRPGGLALVLSSFLTQFMCVPYIGACIAAALYLLIGWMVSRILSSLTGSQVMFGLSFIPTAFLFLCLENDSYLFHGHMAFALAVASVLAYVSLPQDKTALRAAAALLIVPLLYLIAGSVALMFAVTVFVLEILRHGLRGLWALSCPALMFLAAMVCVRTSLADNWETALTPFMYYSNPSTYFFPLYAWASLPLLALSAWAVSRLVLKPTHVTAIAAAGLAVSLFIAWNLYTKVHSRSHYRLITEQHWAEKGEWDRIINTADRRQPTFLVSYLDLALAHKGILTESFMRYNHQDLSSLMYPTPNLKAGFSLQSMVYQSWDYHAAARQAAFDANLVTPGMRNPRQLMILVRTNLALGAVEVAEKYIGILEKTLFYRNWARKMRSSLGQPSQTILPIQDEYVRYDGIKGDMRDILTADPSHRILSQFYQLYLILETEGKK